MNAVNSETEIKNPDSRLAEEVRARTGEDVYRCYQCLKCTAGCPMAFAMDYPPSRVIRMVQLGREEPLLDSKTIWVCLTCYTCSVRCPNDIDIAHVIDALREKALERGRTAAKENIALFHRYFLDTVKKRGRTFESEFLTRYQLKTGQIAGNALLGLRMLMKGRMALLPDSVADKKTFAEIFTRAEQERRGSR